MRPELEHLPAAIALNGPPESGKTHLVSHLMQLIPDAVILRPSDFLYLLMIQEGEVSADLPYAEYKKRPEARSTLIRYATEARENDPHVFDRMASNSKQFHYARVVIIDNFGFPSEVRWFEHHASALLLLRLDSAYNRVEPEKAKSRKLITPWDGDSRSPLFTRYMLTAYDSVQMSLLLNWLTDPQISKDSGPYHEYKQLWDRYFAASESTERDPELF